jgi:predicted membrane channel-forming protein YqfA (hemolysin III family)
MILIGMALASNITGTAMIFNDKITFWALMAIGIILYYSGLVKFLLNEQPKKELPIIVHVGHKLGKRRASRFQ